MMIGSHNTNERTFIIAEIGNNHEGSFALAEEMIERAVESGVDAVKFQTIVPERFVRASQQERMAQLKRFELSSDEYAKLKAIADRVGVVFLSTPYDLESVDFLSSIMPAFKIGSGDNNFYPLLEKIAATGKPIIMSTGVADMAQLRRSTNTIEAVWNDSGIRGELALLHCVSSYPTAPEEVNLHVISSLVNEFPRYTVGYSDHTMGIQAAVASVALGARIIEKHFTVDKNYSDFRDHQLSADPQEMKEIVRQIRELESMLGSGKNIIQPGEKLVRDACRRSIVAARDLPAGTTVSLGDITWMRPGDGLLPGDEHKVVGSRLEKSISKGELIGIMPQESMNKKTIILIPAKGGSKRLPNKNMAPVAGRPMIDWAIDQALSSKKSEVVYVTTDSEEIADHARARGVKVIVRDVSLGGETPLLDVYRHALEQINDESFEVIVGLQPDHPDRNVTVDEAIEAFIGHAGCEMLASKEADGTKNGAHCIVSRAFLESKKNPATDPTEKIMIVDDCTNIHYPEDLRRAEERLRSQA